MCVFKREIDGQQRGCRFSETENFLDKVLVDNDGFCIFHSENEVWKNENNFNLYVDKVIRYFEAAPTEESIFLEDVVFTGNTEKLFSNKEFKKNIILKYSQFKEPLIIKSSTFKNINFKSSIFYKAVSFSAISIKEATFDCAQFKATVHIDKCGFHQNFFMVKTLFSGGLSISNSSFFSNTFFQDIKTNLDSAINQGILFKNSQFKGFTTFEFSEFNALTDFKNIEIHSEFVFHNTQFNYNEPLPHTSSVNFSQIHVKEKGRLEFRGSSDNKMFNNVQDVSIFKETIDGALFFEHTNFTKFSALTRERLITATKKTNAKISIGVGCIKYYNQTPLKSIEISKDNQILAIELCNTFVDYFTNNGGFNLGVEFVTKTNTHICFFYFSDEVVPYEEFEAKLQKSEQQMWRLIKVEGDNLSTQPPKTSVPSKIINATDTMVDLFGLVLKIGSRIPLGLINKEEITHLLNTTLPANSRHSNGFMLNQIVLFGINNKQSIQVKKIG